MRRSISSILWGVVTRTRNVSVALCLVDCIEEIHFVIYCGVCYSSFIFISSMALVFGRPFVKRFALCYWTVVCLSCLSVLSVTLVYCGQTLLRSRSVPGFMLWSLLRTCYGFPKRHSICCGFAVDLLLGLLRNKCTVNRTDGVWASSLMLTRLRHLHLAGLPAAEADQRCSLSWQSLASPDAALSWQRRCQRSS